MERKRDSEGKYMMDINIKHEQVYKATIRYLSNHQIGISWDGEYYRITDESIMTDSKYETREDAYVAALIAGGRKTHALEPKYISGKRR